MIDRQGATTRFTYTGDHFLEDIVNALGVREMADRHLHRDSVRSAWLFIMAIKRESGSQGCIYPGTTSD